MLIMSNCFGVELKPLHGKTTRAFVNSVDKQPSPGCTLEHKARLRFVVQPYIPFPLKRHKTHQKKTDQYNDSILLKPTGAGKQFVCLVESFLQRRLLRDGSESTLQHLLAR